MRRLPACVAVLLALSGVAYASAPSSSGARKPVLVSVRDGTISRLFLADPVSLRRLSGPTLRLGTPWVPAMRSPDGSLLAVCRNDGGDLRFVRLPGMRPAGVMRFRNAVQACPVTWLSQHVLVVALDTATPQLAAVDPVRRQVLWRRQVDINLSAIRRTSAGFVMLVAETDAIGPATLIAVGADGSIRSVVLERILAGTVVDMTPLDPVGQTRWPGVAVDRAGNRAFVVGAGEPVAEVDLASMTVSYQGAFRTFAKAVSGPRRTAAWLGGALIAVAGTDSSVRTDAQGRVVQMTTAASGLSFIDTRTWEVRGVEPEATDVAVVGESLLVFSSRYDSATSTPVGSGVTIYNRDGTPRVHLLQKTPIWQIVAQNGLAYAFGAGRPSRIFVIDAAAGRVLATVNRPTTNLLVTR
jgi:hypothetical protein